MARVRALIVAKTHMSKGVCVGALDLAMNRGMRLLTRRNECQPEDTAFEIGQVWDLQCRPAGGKPPHVEDTTVFEAQRLGRLKVDIRAFLLERLHPWQGEPAHLFDDHLCLQYNSGFICASKGIPSCSTGFWQPDKPLRLKRRQDGKPFYTYEDQLNIPYVGFVEPLETLPAETLVRISLARWWAPENIREDRCYLQLSGWYM